MLSWYCFFFFEAHWYSWLRKRVAILYSKLIASLLLLLLLLLLLWKKLNSHALSTRKCWGNSPTQFPRLWFSIKSYMQSKSVSIKLTVRADFNEMFSYLFWRLPDWIGRIKSIEFVSAVSYSGSHKYEILGSIFLNFLIQQIEQLTENS